MTDSHQPQKEAEEGSGAKQALSTSQDQTGEPTTHPATTLTSPDTKPEATETSTTDTPTMNTATAATTTTETPATGASPNEIAATTPTGDTPVTDRPAAARPTTAAQATEAPHTEAAAAENTGDPVAQPRMSQKRLLIGVGGAFVAVIVVLVIAAFVWPGFLAGPGTPDSTASEAAAALASKNPTDLDKVSCHGPDGKLTSQAVSPHALRLIESAKQVGPPRLSLDTQALVPVELTVTAQGQTQTLPADVVLAVTNGQWCMNGITHRQ